MSVSGGPQILAINSGSSSIKFAVFAADDPARHLARGSITEIGSASPVLRTEGPNGADRLSASVAAPDAQTALGVVIDWIEQRAGRAPIAAIGHRIVHGGPEYHAPQRLTPAVVAGLRLLGPFDPQHLPQALRLIDAMQLRFPDIPQFACFDTGFFHAMPRVAQLLPIPRRYEAQGVRRYGFHGLSYEFLMGELARIAGVEVSLGRIVLAHLGNGASLAAVHHGAPVDTSMGFTPAAGVPMGTRSGDLDPGLISYLWRSEDMSVTQFDEMINFRSGLLGLSETTSDMRELLGREADDVRAAEAVALFCYQIKKMIGGFAAALGGLDVLVFAGGVGENSPVVRRRICDGLGFLGVDLDPTSNADNATSVSRIGSATPVYVIRTDEERMIAEAIIRLLASGAVVQS